MVIYHNSRYNYNNNSRYNYNNNSRYNYNTTPATTPVQLQQQLQVQLQVQLQQQLQGPTTTTTPSTTPATTTTTTPGTTTTTTPGTLHTTTTTTPGTTTTTKDMITGPRNGITAEKIEQEINSKQLKPVTKEGKSFSGKKQITIEGFDFTVNDDKENDGKQLQVEDCEEVTIQYCKFRDKTTRGQGLNIVGDKTKKVTVQYCIFENFSFKESNGGEPLRLGESKYSGCVFECIVKNNIFRNLKSDPECISIKSCNNIIEDNFFIDNESNVAVRHGGLAIIRHNYFKGTNGVRIHGYGNYVGYNCFEDNSASKRIRMRN